MPQRTTEEKCPYPEKNSCHVQTLDIAHCGHDSWNHHGCLVPNVGVKQRTELGRVRYGSQNPPRTVSDNGT